KRTHDPVPGGFDRGLPQPLDGVANPADTVPDALECGLEAALPDPHGGVLDGLPYRVDDVTEALKVLVGVHNPGDERGDRDDDQPDGVRGHRSVEDALDNSPGHRDGTNRHDPHNEPAQGGTDELDRTSVLTHPPGHAGEEVSDRAHGAQSSPEH